MYRNGRRLFSWEDPPPLDVPGRPEMSFFPERITLENRLDTPDGAFLKKAVYIPDLSSFQGDGESGGLWQYSLTYLGVGDPDGEIRLFASLSGDWMEAVKMFCRRRDASVCGSERWDRFFNEVAALPIAPEETCMIVEL